MPIVSACASTRDSDVCPIPRWGELATRVNDDDVLRVGEHRQVGDRVLDLGALVELRAADDLVADLARARACPRAPATARWSGRRPRSRARETPSSTSRSISPTTNRASACSSSSSRTLIGSPSPRSVHSVLPIRPRLWRDHRVGGARGSSASSGSSARAGRPSASGKSSWKSRMLRDVGAAEAVDRVVGDEPVGDEVVRALDVEVVDGPVELDALDRLDDVVAAVLGEHHHARADRGRADERQRVRSCPATGAPEPCRRSARSRRRARAMRSAKRASRRRSP